MEPRPHLLILPAGTSLSGSSPPQKIYVSRTNMLSNRTIPAFWGKKSMGKENKNKAVGKKGRKGNEAPSRYLLILNVF